MQPTESMNDDQVDGIACALCARPFEVGAISTVVGPGPRGLLFKCWPRCQEAVPEPGEQS